MRILVVEDERTLAGFVEQALRAEGYVPTAVHDGDDGIAEALTGDYALVLLDLMLPGRTGLEVLDAIRARKPELPVIVVTAQAAIEQRVEGLDRGANDYVTKPFSFEELLARVRAQLRAPGQREASALEAGGVRIDLRTRRVERDGRQVQLTAREFELLAYLVRHPDQVLSREQILNAVWGFDFDPGTKVLEVYIGYLRRKLGEGDGERADRDGAQRRLPPARARMARRLLPGGLRAQLALAIALVTTVALSLSFVAVYRGNRRTPAGSHRPGPDDTGRPVGPATRRDRAVRAGRRGAVRAAVHRLAELSPGVACVRRGRGRRRAGDQPAADPR